MIIATPWEYHAPMAIAAMLACVVVAGCYGAYSVSRRIFMIQAVPAILALVSRAL